jgi:hypothetical protein
VLSSWYHYPHFTPVYSPLLQYMDRVARVWKRRHLVEISTTWTFENYKDCPNWSLLHLAPPSPTRIRYGFEKCVIAWTYVSLKPEWFLIIEVSQKSVFMQIYAVWPTVNIVTIWLHDLNHVVFRMTNCSQWPVMGCSGEWKLFVAGDRVQAVGLSLVGKLI